MDCVGGSFMGIHAEELIIIKKIQLLLCLNYFHPDVD